MEPTTTPTSSSQTDLARIEAKIDAIHISVEKTRKYLWYTFVGSIVVVVLPLIGLLFAIPSFIDTYTSLAGPGGLGGL
jgi:hypothetical protein